MTGDGVSVRSAGTAHWAWVGLTLTPNPDGEREAEAEIAAAEQAWLAAQWATGHGTRFEIRYTAGGPGRPVSCVLLGRVSGRDLAGVRAAAVALRARLAAVPAHVRAEPMGEADVAAALTPARGDQVELRKRLAWAWCGRQETGRQVCFAVSPLVPGGLSWSKVLEELARTPAGTTVGLLLEPYAPTEGLAVRLRELAVEYATLGSPGRPDPVWNAGQPADPFAAGATAGYRDAVQRYGGRCYRLRVGIVAPGLVDPAFAELLAGAVGGAVVCRPTAADADLAWRDFVTLDRRWLDETHRQGAPAGLLDDAERALCDIVDLTEAGAAVRLPMAALAGGLEPGFPDAAQPGRRVFVSYVGEDLPHVDRLVTGLREAGFDVWIDRSTLLPGQRWQAVIRKAIRAGDFFVACFSPTSVGKARTYMNEELIQAAEVLRQQPYGTAYIIPVRFGACEIPALPIGPGETLDSLHRVDLLPDRWDDGMRRLLATLRSTSD